MKRTRLKNLDCLAIGLMALFALDRFLKLASVIHFFRRPLPPEPQEWPSLTLFQPITRGVSGLPEQLRSRARLSYELRASQGGNNPAAIQHLLICDANDSESQAEIRALLDEFPALQAELILVESKEGTVASKTEKLLAAIPHAKSEVFWFVDDDIGLRPSALRLMIPFLYQPGVGAVFGLACYTNWRTTWSSLMSGFVNTNALLSYIPLTYLTTPFTIT